LKGLSRCYPRRGFWAGRCMYFELGGAG